MDRRTFLVGAGAAGLLAGCTRSPETVPTATTTSAGATSPTVSSAVPPTPSPTRTTAAAGPPDWTALGRSLQGTLSRPGSGGYDSGRRLFDPRYDAVRPAAVVVAAHDRDVAECVTFAARYRIPISVRGGGHSYGGYSTGRGLVVNLSRLSGVDSARRTAGGGANLISLYSALSARGVAVPGGSCPTVGVGGSTQGGGIGVAARGLGLTCDALLGATVVTADGRIRAVDADRDPDLFWALRGGGGGNFGIVTEFRFRPQAVDPVAYRFVRWPASAAARVIPAWLSWVSSGPDELWSNLHLDASPGGAVSLRATITYLGDSAAMERQVDRLAAAAGEPSSRSGSTRSWLSTMKVMAGCSEESLAGCQSYDRQSWAGSSDVIGRPLTAAGATTLVRAAQRFTAGGGSLSVILDALGGKVRRVRPTDTAFWHRAALCTVQYYASLPGGAATTTVRARYAGLAAVRSAMRPYTTGGAYVNYLDPTIKNWPTAYYGGNYSRLQKVKMEYDPDRVFDFPLAIR
jgi:FAD binding domain-containing protein/berberine-like enzyme